MENNKETKLLQQTIYYYFIKISPGSCIILKFKNLISRFCFLLFQLEILFNRVLLLVLLIKEIKLIIRLTQN